VPRVVGSSLTKARTRIRKAHCRVGRIARKASTLRKKGKVLGQAPQAGRKLQNGAKVNLTVGNGPQKKH
jgi:beta-lactam-binding protein with PASTA domain